jgi:hypothetical protein
MMIEWPGHAHALGRQAPAEGDGGGPETTDADAQQHAAEQQQAEVAGVGHDRVGDDHDQRQADQQVAPVQRANAHRHQRGGEGGHDAGQGHHQAGVAGTDARSLATSLSTPTGRNSLVTRAKAPTATERIASHCC